MVSIQRMVLGAVGKYQWVAHGWQVDGFKQAKYTAEQRARQRETFYEKYLTPDVVWDPDEEDDEQVWYQVGSMWDLGGCGILMRKMTSTCGIRWDPCGI